MNLKAQRAAAINAAQDIITKARGEARALTPEELAEVEAKEAEVQSLTAKIEAAEKSAEVMDRVAKLGVPAGGKDADEAPARSLGEHFVKQVDSRELSQLKMRSGYRVGTTEFKVNTDPQLRPASLAPTVTEVDQTIVRGFRRPTVADVLGTGTLSGNAVTYFVEGSVEGSIAAVAENGQKPQIHFTDPTAVTDSLKKIAAWWDTSDEMTEDLEFWESEINNRALYLLALAEENQLVNGDGLGANVLGLLNRVGIQTETQGIAPDTAADTIFRALTKVQTATGLSADAILINPADYQTLRLSKDGNGQYFGGGIFSGQYGQGGIPMQPPLWGVNTIVTPAVAAKTVIVGALRTASTVYRKGGVRVEATNSDLGKFTKNIITTRIEERVALALRMPLAVVKVTLL